MTWPRIYDKIDCSWLYEQYVANDRTMQDIAEEKGCDRSTIRRAILHCGITPKPGGRYALRIDAERVRRLYWERELTTAEIAAGLGCTRERLRQAMIREGIDRRNSWQSGKRRQAGARSQKPGGDGPGLSRQAFRQLVERAERRASSRQEAPEWLEDLLREDP